MATLSDEDFQRLNDQLVELKSHNYNVEANLRKALEENRTLQMENEQLRKRLPTENRKSLNPIAFAKSIATKVDSRLHHQQNSPPPLSNNCQLSPESDLKGQIAGLQAKIQQLEMENYRMCHLDSSFSECLTILKAAIHSPIINEKIIDYINDETIKISYEEMVNKIDDFKTFCYELDRYYQNRISNLETIIVNISDKLKEVKISNESSGEDWHQKELNNVKQELEELKKNSDEKISKFQKEIDELNQKHRDQISSLSVELDQTREKVREFQKQTELLQNQISECQNEKKISEKRGFKIIKELKKQLQIEKNRADKLQQILNNEDGEKSFELTTSNGGCGTGTSDKGSSTGSWSYMNEPSVQTKLDPEFSDLEICDDNNSGSGDHHQSQRRPRAMTLEQENTQLLEKISALQQDKWCLEERINQLERELSARRSTPASPSSPTMSSPNSKPPAAIINNSILKVINYIREKSDPHHHQDPNSRQINEAHRKLQRMVEEILTKNMHLQASLEEMSNELIMLKKQQQQQ